VPGNGYSGFNVTAFFAFYNINITAGAASSPLADDIAAEGQTVAITAADAPAGEVFKKWVATPSTIAFADASDPATTFIMPAADAAIEAQYGTLYSITAANGTASIDENPVTEAFEGDEITLVADDAPAGKIFANWTNPSGNITFANENNATTIFIMPAADVSVEATYSDLTAISNAGTGKATPIYPNPATQYIRIAGLKDAPYIIADTIGKTVGQGKTQGETVSITHLPRGIYILKADGKAIRFVKK
jgi:hypothetical protein